MFDWLTAPLGSLLGGLAGGAGSVAGAQIAANEQQQINQQNIQQAQWMATGQYLPGLISSAQKAGINPLVAMGVHTPAAPTGVSSGTGGGAAGAGAALSGAINSLAHEDRLQARREALADEQIRGQQLTAEQQHWGINQQILQWQKDQWVFNRLKAAPPDTLTPGGEERSFFGIPGSWAHEFLFGRRVPYQVPYPGTGSSINVPFPTNR